MEGTSRSRWCLTCVPEHLTDIFSFVLQDEAFELGRQWAKFYEPESPARKLVDGIMDTYCLVNVVHNDFKKPDAIFEPFFKAGAEFAAKHGVAANGHAINGHAN